MSAVGKASLIAISAGLLVSPVLTPIRLQLQTADPGTAEQALNGAVTAYCLPSDVSSRALSRWVRRYLPAGQPTAGLPWCDLRQLSDGGYFQRWGAAHTSGIVYSDPRSPSAQLVILGESRSCQ